MTGASGWLSALILSACAVGNSAVVAAPAATVAAPQAAAGRVAPDRTSTAIAAAQSAADHDRALAILDAALQANPRDVRLRFARAVRLSEAGRQELALAAFTELTQEFPELPEPHNNLAAIHAQRGELDLARAQLEMALRAFPGYALARENLGDLYLRLAERSYLRSLEGKPENASVRTKLTLTKELINRITTMAPQ